MLEQLIADVEAEYADPSVIPMTGMFWRRSLEGNKLGCCAIGACYKHLNPNLKEWFDHVDEIVATHYQIDIGVVRGIMFGFDVSPFDEQYRNCVAQDKPQPFQIGYEVGKRLNKQFNPKMAYEL